ncbi:MAG: hypothetical protein K8I29_01570 [Alphaproteobacteria bacterium]|uniref:Uncharacterized protein n=1 Tax=Candidatus Nitrobium versatile TaxID=2884831 RepID=A0A953J587_9BACT|nr:hypothetical protein [Candidatus Nitrobium versatile]
MSKNVKDIDERIKKLQAKKMKLQIEELTNLGRATKEFAMSNFKDFDGFKKAVMEIINR